MVPTDCCSHLAEAAACSNLSERLSEEPCTDPNSHHDRRLIMYGAISYPHPMIPSSDIMNIFIPPLLAEQYPEQGSGDAARYIHAVSPLVCSCRNVWIV